MLADQWKPFPHHTMIWIAQAFFLLVFGLPTMGMFAIFLILTVVKLNLCFDFSQLSVSVHMCVCVCVCVRVCVCVCVCV